MSAASDSKQSAAADAPPPPPPPLMKLLRQLSSDARTGIVSADQKSKIKSELLHAADGKTAAAPTAAAAAAGPTSNGGSDESTPPPPLLPLLRQLSACARDGLIDAQQKSHIKSLLLRGSVGAAKELIDSKSKSAGPARTLVLSSFAGGFISPERQTEIDKSKQLMKERVVAERNARAEAIKRDFQFKVKRKVEADRARAAAVHAAAIAAAAAAGANGAANRNRSALRVLQPAAPVSTDPSGAGSTMNAARDVLTLIFSFAGGDDILGSVIAVCKGWQSACLRDAVVWRRRCIAWAQEYELTKWDRFGVAFWVRTYRYHSALKLTGDIKQLQLSGAAYRPSIAQKYWNSPFFDVWGSGWMCAPVMKLWKHPVYRQTAVIVMSAPPPTRVARDATPAEPYDTWLEGGVWRMNGWYDPDLMTRAQHRAYQSPTRNGRNVALQIWCCALQTAHRPRLILELLGQPLLCVSFPLGLVAVKRTDAGLCVYAFEAPVNPVAEPEFWSKPERHPNRRPCPRPLWTNYLREEATAAHFYAIPLPPTPAPDAKSTPSSAAASAADVKSPPAASSNEPSPHPGLAGIVLAVSFASGDVALFDALTGRLRNWCCGATVNAAFVSPNAAAGGASTVAIPLPVYQSWLDTQKSTVLEWTIARVYAEMGRLHAPPEVEKAPVFVPGATRLDASGKAIEKDKKDDSKQSGVRSKVDADSNARRLKFLDRRLVELELERDEHTIVRDDYRLKHRALLYRTRYIDPAAPPDSALVMAANAAKGTPHRVAVFAGVESLYDCVWPYPPVAITSSTTTLPLSARTYTGAAASTVAAAPPLVRPMILRIETTAEVIPPKPIVRGGFSTTSIEVDQTPIVASKATLQLIDVASGKASKPFAPQEPAPGSDEEPDSTKATDVVWSILYSPVVNPVTGFPYEYATPPASTSGDEKKPAKRSPAAVGSTAGPIVVCAHRNGEILATDLLGRTICLATDSGVTEGDVSTTTYLPALDERSGLFVLYCSESIQPSFLWDLNHFTKTPLAPLTWALPPGPGAVATIRQRPVRTGINPSPLQLSVSVHGVRYFLQSQRRVYMRPWSTLIGLPQDTTKATSATAMIHALIRAPLLSGQFTNSARHGAYEYRSNIVQSTSLTHISSDGVVCDGWWQDYLPMQVGAVDTIALADDTFVLRQPECGRSVRVYRSSGDDSDFVLDGDRWFVGANLRYRIYSLLNRRKQPKSAARANRLANPNQYYVTPASAVAETAPNASLPRGFVATVEQAEGSAVWITQIRVALSHGMGGLPPSRYWCERTEHLYRRFWLDTYASPPLIPAAAAAAAAASVDAKTDAKSNGLSTVPAVSVDPRSDFGRSFAPLSATQALHRPLPLPKPTAAVPASASASASAPAIVEYKIGEPLLLVMTVYLTRDELEAFQKRKQDWQLEARNFRYPSLRHAGRTARNWEGAALRVLSIAVVGFFGPILIYKLLEDFITKENNADVHNLNRFGAINVNSPRLVRPPKRKGDEAITEALNDVPYPKPAAEREPPAAVLIAPCVGVVQAGWW